MRSPVLLEHTTIPRRFWGLVDSSRDLVAPALLVGIAVLAGAAVPKYGLFTLVGGAIIALLGTALVNVEPIERALTFILLVGGFILGYGFANVGIPGPVPLPATEIVFIPLAAAAFVFPETRLHRQILLPLCLFAGVVFIRLAVDYPTWGVFAIRDSTIGLEAFIVAVGYRAMKRDGVQTWIRRMGWVMSGVLIYGGLLYPWRHTVEALGPTVGLQRPVPLLDLRGTKFAVIAAALYFLVFSRGWKRTLAVALITGLIGVFQARTLYILFPLTLILLGWVRRQQIRTWIRLVPVFVLGALLIAAMGSISVEGRRGPVDPQFIEAHARTLLGEEGPMSGSIRGRQDWLSRTIEEVTKSPSSIVVGLGLGPDLTFGQLRGNDDRAIRKPHDDYLEVFARLGAVGLFLFLWFLLACLIPIIRRARSGSGLEERFCAWIFVACVVYLGVAGAQPLLSFPYGSIPLFFMLGMGAAVAHHDLQAGSIPVEKPVR